MEHKKLAKSQGIMLLVMEFSTFAPDFTKSVKNVATTKK